MCATALSTPLPEYRFASPSRNSTASREPVEAPVGTAARPTTPECSITSASTVGLPRESMISRPRISTIRLMGILRAGYVGIDAGEETPRRMSKQGFLERLLFHRRVQFLERGQERGHAIQRPGIRAVRQGFRRIGMRLHE